MFFLDQSVQISLQWLHLGFIFSEIAKEYKTNEMHAEAVTVQIITFLLSPDSFDVH